MTGVQTCALPIYLKVEGPDEFDFMICLEQLSSPGACVTKDIPMRPVPDPG